MQAGLGQELLFSLTVPARPDRLALIRALVQKTAESAGCSSETGQRLVIAVNEACMNIIQHAYRGDEQGSIKLEARRAARALYFRLEDHAAPIDLDAVEPRALDDIRPGGLGVHFIREIMDVFQMGHLPDGRGNFLEMIKNIE